jgi:galactokinase
MNSDSETIKSLKTILTKRHRIDPNEIRVIRAPYRVCPLGAHIDHQLGQVTAMALDRGIALAYAPSASGEVYLSSLDFPGEVEFHIGRVSGKKDDDWGNYPRGAATALQQKYNLQRGIYGMTSGKLGEGGYRGGVPFGIRGSERSGGFPKGQYCIGPSYRKRLSRP